MTHISSITRRLLLAGGVAALTIGAAGVASAEDISFEGKTIEIMVNFAAGGGTDTAARLVAPYIAQHLPGNPSVIVTNKAGAGGTAAVDFLIDSVAPDGAHIGYFSGTPLRWALGMQQVPEGTGDLHYVAGRSVNQIVQASTKSGLTAETLKGYDKPVFLAINSPDNHVAIRMRMLSEVMGIEDFTVVGGYAGQGNMVAAVRSGEAEIAQTNDSFYGANRDAILGDGVITTLAQMGEYVDGKIVSQKGLEDIPVFDALWREHSPETLDSPQYEAWEAFHIGMSIQNVFVLPPETPEEFVPVWEAAILAAYSDPGYIAQVEEAGVPEPASVGTAGLAKSLERIQSLFANPEVRAVIEAAIERNME